MKKPTNQRNVAPLSQRPRRARLLAGISVIAAAGFIPGTAQAAELNFADYAKAVQSSQALAIAPAAAESNRTILSPAIAALPSGLDEFAVERLEVGHSPILSVGLVGHETAAVRGAEATFIGYSNYPAALERGEIRIFDAAVSSDQTPHAVVPMATNGAAHWTPTTYASPDMQYVYRVYDAEGNFDETGPQALKVVEPGALIAATNASRPTFGVTDSASHRSVSLVQAQPVIAYGKVSDASAILTIEGQIVPLDSQGNFTASLLQPEACEGLKLTVTSSCGARSDGLAARDSWNAVAPPARTVTTGVAPVSGFEIRTAPEGQPVAPDHALEVRADGHAAEPVMSIGLIGSERTVVVSSPAQFQTYTNYPSYVAKGEVRIFVGGSVTDSPPLAVVATDANGFAQWQPGADAPRDLFYTFRVYDDRGRFDESQAQELTLVPEPVSVDGAPVVRPTFGMVDEAQVRNIPMNRTATITVSGLADPSKDMIRVSGQLVPVNPDGKFITQQLVDRDSKDVRVTIEREGQTTFAQCHAATGSLSARAILLFVRWKGVVRRSKSRAMRSPMAIRSPHAQRSIPKAHSAMAGV